MSSDHDYRSSFSSVGSLFQARSAAAKKLCRHKATLFASNYQWDLYPNFTRNVPLDKEQFIKFWKSVSLDSRFGLNLPWLRSVDI